MTSSELRRTFLAYFEQHGHRIVSSAPLVPGDDPTLLFTNAGMNQFKDVFLGKDRREYRRATSSQKCMRVSGKHNDLENVGPSLRHHTFFEMLGNFSFGDYFKKDAIELAWGLLVDVWKLPPERLYATIFKGEAGIPRDDEAWGHWRKVVPVERIFELGAADNFWSMGETGPCGRCSEIHYYRGEQVPCPEPVCRGLECSCDRFIEVWNNVFMEFDRQVDGSLVPLPAPSIDTGMGLERITALMQDKLSNYDTDLFEPLLAAIGAMVGRTHGGTMDPADVSMRVIADHARASTFLIADGVVPSNEWRGYVLRKIMRRAMRHGHKLGIKEPFLYTLVDVLVAQMGDAYPDLRASHSYVSRVVHTEEDRFDAVLAGGLPRLEDLLDRSAAAGVVSGDDAFKLYDSFGMPVDFIEDLAGQRNLPVDRAAFDRALEAQRVRARAKSAFGGAIPAESFAVGDAAREALEAAGDHFDGYTAVRVADLPVIALLNERGAEQAVLTPGQDGYVALGRTPFYVESGGQVSDSGRLVSEDGSIEAQVTGMARGLQGWPRLHRVHVERGLIRPGDTLTAEVDVTARNATRRNHTGTHLLHAALRRVLGTHVKQAGSMVSPERLRFDFVHYAPLTAEQKTEIEQIVGEQIFTNTAVTTDIKATQDAIANGAMALFGEKYGDAVRVVTVEGFSQELCGGTHCQATGDIGPFVIVEEGGIAAGVRRIEAVTGATAVTYLQERRQTLDQILERLNVTPALATEAIERLQAEQKRLVREVGQLKMKAALSTGSAEADDIVTVGDVQVLTRRVEGLDKSGLRDLADSLKGKLGTGVVILASADDGKVSFVVSVTANLTDRVHAGKVVKQIAPVVGGGGGGRADFAEAGGKQPEKIDELLATARQVLQAALAS